MVNKKVENIFTYEDIEKLLQGIKNCGNQTAQPFRNKLMRNAGEWEDALKKQKDTMEESPEIKEYREKEQAIVSKYAEGFDRNGPRYGENHDIAVGELKSLQNKYEDTLNQARIIHNTFYETAMKEPYEGVVRMIPDTELPKLLTLEQCMGISKLITYADEGKKKKTIPNK